MDELATAEGLRKLARTLAEALVERAWRQLGSKMEAYRHVAEATGVSATWLRKLLSDEPMTLYAHKGFSILIAFLEMCDQIEQDLERERKRIADLKSLIPAWMMYEVKALQGEGPPLEDVIEDMDEEELEALYQSFRGRRSH
jgi:hypothetical protein